MQSGAGPEVRSLPTSPTVARGCRVHLSRQEKGWVLLKKSVSILVFRGWFVHGPGFAL